MLATQENIERKAIEYCFNNEDVKPKYVLMDIKTYEDFTKSFTPKEKVVLKQYPEVQPDDLPRQVTKLTLTDFTLEILCVKTDRKIFEVVG